MPRGVGLLRHVPAVGPDDDATIARCILAESAFDQADCEHHRVRHAVRLRRSTGSACAIWVREEDGEHQGDGGVHGRAAPRRSAVSRMLTMTVLRITVGSSG